MREGSLAQDTGRAWTSLWSWRRWGEAGHLAQEVNQEGDGPLPLAWVAKA